MTPSISPTNRVKPLILAGIFMLGVIGGSGLALAPRPVQAATLGVPFTEHLFTRLSTWWPGPFADCHARAWNRAQAIANGWGRSVRWSWRLERGSGFILHPWRCYGTFTVLP